MGKEFITDGALCMCQYGAAPGKLKVSFNDKVTINGGKKIATNMDLGNCFQPPGFGSCNQNPMMSKPCNPSVVQWSNAFEKLKIKSAAHPLMPNSKAICAIAGSECIQIQNHGQVAVLGTAQMNNSSAEHQTELDPAGDPQVFGENEEDENFDILSNIQ